MAVCRLHIVSKGKKFVCLYDSDDHELISRYTWRTSQGYVKSLNILLHRLILGVTNPELFVDHIDHNGLNNQRSNLRICTRSENQYNRFKQESSSKFKGVTRNSGRYMAMIRYNKERFFLGRYRSEISAAKAYDRASRELHKEFGFTNFNEADDVPIQLTLCI